MKIIFNKVTKFSQVIAIIVFVGVYFLGISLGQKIEKESILGEPITHAKFICADNKMIDSNFYKTFVEIKTNTLKTTYLTQTISASGARYANSDESIVFWNKGETAFITEGDLNNPTYKDCLVVLK